MGKVGYIVVKGDTLSEIAWKYNSTYNYGKTVKEATNTLARINNISNPDYIVVGQVLELYYDPSSGESGSGSSGSDSGSTTTTTPTPTNAGKPVINVFGLQSNTDRTIYVTWAWDTANTENYQVKWYYDTGDNVWFIGSDSTTEEKHNLYTAPENANRVKVIVKPNSKTRTVNDTEVAYFTAGWSTAKIYNFSDNPPGKPDVPKVEIKNYKLTASLTNIDSKLNVTQIQFQIVKDDSVVFNTGVSNIVTTKASYSCNVTAGGQYKVRCRGMRAGFFSDWSEYSDNYTTQAAASDGITTCKAISETAVYLEWSSVSNAETYEIEYTTDKTYFDGSDSTTTVSSIEYPHYTKTGLESGHEYFFRVRAVNSQGKSAWSGIQSVVLGTNPTAPTTWSSSSVVITGEPLTLYWTHNVEDNSSQTFADVELYVNGLKETYTVRSVDEEADEKTMHYEIDTSEYTEGTKIEWRVRTAGVTETYGDWSVQRTVNIYVPPTLTITMKDPSGNAIETLTSFPFYISGIAGPNTQKPIGYHLTVVAESAYETVDDFGNPKMVPAGSEIYSKQFDTSEELLVEFSAGNINLENNIRYAVICVVSMSSSLTSTALVEFDVAWEDEQYVPNAEIGIDKDTVSAIIRPYCVDENNELVEGIELSVYRREFDGSYVEIAKGLTNTEATYITDPHPALDLARYRIVATVVETGATSYYDVPGYPVQEKSIIIQWDEKWTDFDTDIEEALEQPNWSGSMLKLPYNIDVSDSHSPEFSLVKYIGRKRPVSYYGTQLGETATWNVDIAKNDKETLYALRRLAVWMGDVYIREPSGSGYWACMTISFSQKHRDLTIPVSMSITRVSGGV